MPMPKAAMNKNDGFVFGQNDIGFTRKGFIVQFVTETLGVEKPTDDQLWFSIGRPDPAHVIAAGFFIVYVRHTGKR